MYTCSGYLGKLEKCLALPVEKRDDLDYATTQGI